MNERERERDPYWSDDVLLGEEPLPDGPSLVRLRLHESEEPYHGRTIVELVALRHPTGMSGSSERVLLGARLGSTVHLADDSHVTA